MYDEYLVAYRDLAAVPRGKASWGALPQAVVCDGQVIGTWRVRPTAASPKVSVDLGRRLTVEERRQLDWQIDRYTQFALVS